MALEEGQSVESPDDFTKDPQGLQKRWKSELALAIKEFEPWTKKVEKIVKRYRDKRGDGANEGGDNLRRLNLLWANVQTELPAVYQRPPKPQVGRRFKAKDPIARTAAAILERYLEVDLERDVIDEVMPKVVFDRLIAGRGQVWEAYEPIIDAVQTPVPVQQTPQGFVNYDGSPYMGPPPLPGPDGVLMGSRPDEKIVDCRAPARYLFWKDFLHSPARAWDEVRWVARRHYYTRDECAKEYAKGMEQFRWEKEDIPLTSKATMSKDMEDETQNLFKRAEIWELWDNQGHILFICTGMDVPMEVKAQPVKFAGKWPCPKPYYGTLTNESLVPEPDFCQWQDLADEIDELTERITALTKAIKMVGTRSASEDALDRMLQETCDNELIPVQNWAAFAEKGGVAGAISWLPLEQIMGTVASLNGERANRIELAYQVSGMSDLMRGQSDPATTATAERIKSNYGSLRIQAKQQALALFVEDMLQIKAEIIAEMAPPEVLMMVSSIQDTDDAQFAQQACQLLKDEKMRNFKIDVDEQSMAAIDDEQEKSERMEFLNAVGPFIQQVAGAMQQAPQMMDIAAESLGYVVRGFRGGRDLEGAMEQFTTGMRQAAEDARKKAAEAAQKPPEPPPEVALENLKAQNAMALQTKKQQDDMAIEALRTQNKQAEMMAQTQSQQVIEQAQAQSQQAIEAFKANSDMELQRVVQAAKERELAMQAEFDARQTKLEAELDMRIKIMEARAEERSNAMRDRMMMGRRKLTFGEDGEPNGSEPEAMEH